jgi:hypothetical protein
LADLPRPLVALAALVVLTEAVAGWRVLGVDWQGGDLLYHSALTNAILRGEMPPGGAYAGLPVYYPPGFHALVAAIMAALGLGFTRADQLLTLAWLPVLPIGTFLLARWLTGRPWVALLAATLTVFGGAYDLAAGRLWVNSLFMAGHEAYPVYPRDIVFGLLPFALLAFLRALAADRRRPAIGWAVLAGVLFGSCALVQVQLLLPLPPALLAVGLVVAARRPDRRWRAIGVVLLTGSLAVALFAPWLLGQLEAIRTNGGIALQSADTLVAARFGPWSYPREFGLLLPLGLVGSGVALLFLRRPDGPRPGGDAVGPWRPALIEAPLGLVAWFGLAFALGVLYQPDWPLEDALRPQRLWLLSSQPMAILAAIGLAALVEDLVGRRWAVEQGAVGRGARRAVAGSVALAIVLACAPTTVATSLLLADTWTRPTYAHLDLARDRVPAFADLLPRGTPRTTVLTYEDWSSLAWYETGEPVVGLLPAGFAKLAFDPAIFSGRGEEDRRTDLLRAFDGEPADLAAVAGSYDARTIVLARRGERLGLIDAAAAIAAGRPGMQTGRTAPAEGNGWDGLALEASASFDVPVLSTGAADLEIRVLAAAAAGRRLVVRVIEPGGAERSSATVAVPPAGPDTWQVLDVAVTTVTGDRLRFEALDPMTVQSVRGFVPVVEAGPIMAGAIPVPGWRVTAVTSDAVVLEPVR